MKLQRVGQSAYLYVVGRGYPAVWNSPPNPLNVPPQPSKIIIFIFCNIDENEWGRITISNIVLFKL